MKRQVFVLAFILGFLVGFVAHAQGFNQVLECSDQGKVGLSHQTGVKPTVRYILDGSQKSYEILNPNSDLKLILRDQ